MRKKNLEVWARMKNYRKKNKLYRKKNDANSTFSRRSYFIPYGYNCCTWKKNKIESILHNICFCIITWRRSSRTRSLPHNKNRASSPFVTSKFYKVKHNGCKKKKEEKKMNDICLIHRLHEDIDHSL